MFNLMSWNIKDFGSGMALKSGDSDYMVRWLVSSPAPSAHTAGTAVTWHNLALGATPPTTTPAFQGMQILADVIRNNCQAVMVLEVAVARTAGTLFGQAPSNAAQTLAQELVKLLTAKTSQTWKFLLSGADSDGTKADAYGVICNTSAVQISSPAFTMIQKQLNAFDFGVSIRSLGCVQVTDSGGHSGWLAGFHAPQPTPQKLAAGADQEVLNLLGQTLPGVSATNIVACGDFNVDFNKKVRYQEVYNYWFTQFGELTALGNNTQPKLTKNPAIDTSLRGKVKGGKYTVNAYDNFLYSHLQTTVQNAGVVDVVSLVASWIAGNYPLVYPNTPAGNLLALTHALWIVMPGTKTFPGSTVSTGVSDHLPIACQVQF